MAEGNSNQRVMQLTTPLGPDALMLTELSGSEQLSQLYSFELKVQAPSRRPIAFDALLGQNARVDILLPNADWAEALSTGKPPEPRYRRFCGIVHEVTEHYFDTYFVYYQLTLRPQFSLATLQADCRIFQEKSVAEILQEILQPWNVEFRLTNQYQSRPYCVQYNETTYQFATRLMAEEGIFFYFEHQYDGQDNQQHHQGEKLIVADSSRNLPPVGFPAADQDPPEIVFDDIEGGNRPELRIKQWRYSQQLVTTKATLRDHHFQLPEQSLEAEEQIVNEVSIGAQTFRLAPLDQDLEHYQYPGNYAKQFDGIDQGGGERPDDLTKVFDHNHVFAKRDVERFGSRAVKIRGVSDCPQMSVGHRFSLNRDGQVSGPFFLTTVEHHAKLNADFLAATDNHGQTPAPSSTQNATETHTYENRFHCHPESLPFQPEAPVDRPKIHGFQTATVVGPEGEEVFSDKFGRIKVQFPWDRLGKQNADSSCWIRVAQVWAGNRWGAFFWPRVGHEVVVNFENGDPDLPLIVGSVYNSKNMPPMSLPSRLHSCGIKSCSIGGNPMENYSCTIFHDGKDEEYLQLHSETHECMTSEISKLHVSTGLAVDLQGGPPSLLKSFGSGAGGGPIPQPEEHSIDKPPVATEATSGTGPPELMQLQQTLQAVLDTFQIEGSGSGGILAELLEGGGTGSTGDRIAALTGMAGKAGELKLSSEDAVTTKLGTTLDHAFNAKLAVSADLEQMLLTFPGCLIPAFAAANEAISAAAWGADGNFTLCFGSRSTLLYGPQLNVRRGRNLVFNEEHFFAMPSLDPVTFGSVTRLAAKNAIKILAVLVLLMDIAMAIAIKVILEKAKPEGASE